MKVSLWLVIGAHLLIFHFSDNKRQEEGYVEERLNKALEEKLEYLEEKIEMAKQSKSFFGEEMYKKLLQIDEMRNEALVLDRGNV